MHFYKGGTFLQDRHIFTREAHFYQSGTFLQGRHIFTRAAHFYKGAIFLQGRHIFTSGTHFYKGSTFLQGRQSFARAVHFYRGGTFLPERHIFFKGSTFLQGRHIYTLLMLSAGTGTLFLTRSQVTLPLSTPLLVIQIQPHALCVELSQDIFQTKIDQTLEGCEGVAGLADDIVVCDN